MSLCFSGCQGYAQKDLCVTASEIRNTIENFINHDDKTIYKKKFITSFTKINKFHNECYFPGNGKDVNLYFYLGDSILLKKVKTDEKAMKLLIDLYLININNCELSEYYGTRIIHKAAIENTEAFVKILTKKTEREVNKCISKLKMIEHDADKEKIRKELSKLRKRKYLPIVNKILERLS